MTSWNNTANENAHIPKSIIICDELPPINNPAIINIHESLEPQFANGTNALLIEIGAYPFDAEHQVADRDDLVGRADGAGGDIVVPAEHKDVDKAQQHEQHIFDKDRPGQAEQVHSFVHRKSSFHHYTDCHDAPAGAFLLFLRYSEKGRLSISVAGFGRIFPFPIKIKKCGEKPCANSKEKKA